MPKPGRSDIVVAVLVVGAIALGALGFAGFTDDTANSLLFAAWTLALLALFMLALRLPLRGSGSRLSAWLTTALVGTGLFASALTGNQVVAALISLSVFLLLWIIDNFGWLLPSPFDTLVVNLSLSVHFKPFAVGSIYLSDVGFFLSVALLTLLLSVRALARR